MSEVVERYAGTVIGREYRRVLAAMSAETTGEA